MIEWTTVILGLMVVVVPALIGFAVKLYTDVNVLESRLSDRDKSLEVSAASVTAQSIRLAVVEGVSLELKALINAFKDIPVLLAKVETLIDADRQRLDRLEDKVYSHNS